MSRRKVVVTHQSMQTRRWLLSGTACLVLLVGLVSYEVGQNRAGFSRIGARESSALLEAQLKDLAKENKSLSEQIAVLETSMKVDSEAYRKVESQLVDLQSRILEQQEDIETIEKSPELKTIVAVGDSLTAGYGLDESESYPLQLEAKLQADGYNFRVVNAGISAETSSGTLSRMEWILTLDPDIVILETGANDGLRGIDPQVAEDNIREMLRLLQERDVVVLLAGMKMVWNLGPSYVTRFNEIYPKLAGEYNVVFFPFFLDGVATEKDKNLSDGVHPNKEGYRIITENIYPYVLEAIKRYEGS